MLSLVVDQEPLRETPSLRFAPRVPPAVLKELAAAIDDLSDDTDLATVLREDELRRRVAAVSESEAAAAQASRLLLADLVLFGWTARVVDDVIWLDPPAVEPRPGETPEAFKRRQREAIQPLRLRQLRETSVNAFLRRMETPRFHAGNRVSVLDLIDDGAALAAELQAVSQLPPSLRSAALERIVRPIVEVASPTTLCPHTGLPTLEIWRYLRHTWSSEYRSTPGRSLFLLVRNAARPKAPVMGIACLANATLQLNVRDNWIGWTRPSIISRLKQEPGCQGEVLAALLQTVRRARGEIRSSDLLQQAGRLKGEALERQLEQIASDALKRRKYLLTERRRLIEKNKDVGPLKSLPVFKNGGIDWRTASESPLFVAKRAGSLADLYFAERVLGRISTHGLSIVGTLDEGGPEGTRLARALSIAAREVRKVGLASRLLELSVCGAVPPYRDLLAGKLTALVVASAEVADAYAARYQGQVSEIASQMAGKPVSRDASVCVIMTTSLYGVIASQYNRLKLRLGAPREASLHWQEIGERTEGKGTAHISDETIAALRDLTSERVKHQNVNNVFGEGQSPRLRQAREGLDQLKLDADVYLRHNMPRRVYGLELFPGARQTLCMNEAVVSRRVPLAEIADGWRSRWLAPRILNRDVLTRVGAAGPETVRAELTPPRGNRIPGKRSAEVGCFVNRVSWGHGEEYGQDHGPPQGLAMLASNLARSKNGYASSYSPESALFIPRLVNCCELCQAQPPRQKHSQCP